MRQEEGKQVKMVGDSGRVFSRPGRSVGDLTGATTEPCRAAPEPMFGPVHVREKQGNLQVGSLSSPVSH